MEINMQSERDDGSADCRGEGEREGEKETKL